ncbi:MAG TPA: SusC/RagA family TonB-linked outer membrane protein [Gemmatimonadaceae bacterium]
MTARMLVACAVGAALALGFALPLPVRAQAAGVRGAVPAAPSPASTQAGAPSAQNNGPPMKRRVSLDLQNVRLDAALDAIDRQARLGLQYTARVVPVDRRVTIRRNGTTAGEALEEVLRGTGVEVVVTSGGKVMLVKGERKQETEAADTVVGAIGGRVTDAETKAPLEGVTVTLKGTAFAAATNDVGGYVILKVPAGVYTLVVRFLGYQAAEREVLVVAGKIAREDFALKMAMSRLQETVTTATGQQRRVELGNDITVINADSIVRTQPVTSVTDLLEGRVPGMVIQRTSGAPGDPARIRLRGASSPRLSNDPIIVVDGIRVYSDQSGERGGNLAGTGGATTSYAAPSPLDYIDPNSIETIEVIKGPSAATLYGQDAANGVIVITTKKGQAGPARWTMSMERGMTEMAGSYPDLMLRWGHPVTDDTPVFCPINNKIGGAAAKEICQADSTVRFQMLNDRDLTVLDQGKRTAATIGVSGGSEALTYNVTGSYRDEVGLVKLPTYEAERYRAEQGTEAPDWMVRPQALTRWGASSRLMARLGSKADVSLSANLSRTEQQRSGLEQQLGKLMSTYLDRNSGSYYQRSGGGGDIQPTSDVLTGYRERATATATQFTNGANLNWRPLSWLTTTADAGISVVQRADEILLPHRSGIGSAPDGRLRLGNGTSVSSTVNVRALAVAPIGHGFKVQLATGANYAGQSVGDLSGDVRGLADGTEAPYQGSIMTVRRGSVDQATFGWYIEPQISHKRAWLSTGIRLDGGSAFGTKVKLPAFPKLSFSYLVSDEGFFPFKDLIPSLRLRIAYGQAGRQPGPVDKLRLYSAAVPVLVGDKFADGVVLGSVGNTKLRPERSTEMEGGFDADLFDDRLTLSFTGFRKTTTDAMLPVPLAPSVYGTVSTLQNIGVIRNTGLEASLAARVLRSDPVSWDVQIAMTQQRNVVVELGAGVEPFYSQGNYSVGGARVAAGYPLNGRWTRPIIGYADANGSGVLEPEEVLVGDTAVFVGGTLPNYTADLNTTLTFLRGAVAVTAGLRYEDGMTQNNEVGRALGPFTAGWNDPNSSLDAQARMWDPTGYSWIQTVSTLRFNSLSVTYNVPKFMAQRVGARAVSVSLQGTNLGLRTNYRGIDPNVNAYSTGNAVTDTGVLPQPRSWQIRLNATY